MKKTKLVIITITVFLSCTQLFAQEVVLPKDSSGKINYTEVVQSDSSSANQLHSKARIWIADAFKSAKDVIQLDDKENHILIAKGVDKLYYKGLMGERYDVGWINFTVRIDSKDNRFKYSITDFQLEGQYGIIPAEKISGTQNQKKYEYEQVNTIAEELLTTLKVAMNKKLTASSEW